MQKARILTMVLLFSLAPFGIYEVIAGETTFQKSAQRNPSLDDTDTSIGPRWRGPTDEMRPWFAHVQERVNMVWGEDRDRLKVDEAVSFTFFMKANGEMDDLFVWVFNNHRSAENAALKILQKSAPFKNPPVPLLYKKRILVTFSRDSDGTPNPRVEWDCSNHLQWKEPDSEFQKEKQMRANRMF